jgi:predicted O-linked N-acetylglucosamine transferase (SPINDLY family)
MRRRLATAFSHWRDVAAHDDAAAAGVIAGDALDVLVDLKGHTHGSRLPNLAQRPAPVQLHWLGFPGTLAHPAIDGNVADAITVPPGAEAEFAERVLRLPVCYQVNDARRPLPPAPSRASVGLPDDAIVLACFNQTYKVTGDFFATWLAALQAHTRTVLWLAVPHPTARRNLQALAGEAGVAPARIVFAPLVPQAQHVARLRCADLALDVLPYGSHTTGSDALWAGVPLLTCRGTTFAGRVGASLCHATGLDDLVAGSLPAYAATLHALCGDPERLAGYRAHLEARRHTLPLFDTPAFTRAFEDLLAAQAS